MRFHPIIRLIEQNTALMAELGHSFNAKELTMSMLDDLNTALGNAAAAATQALADVNAAGVRAAASPTATDLTQQIAAANALTAQVGSISAAAKLIDPAPVTGTAAPATPTA